MGPRLNWLGALVTAPDESWSGVQIIVRDTDVRLSRGPDEVAVRADVASVDTTGARTRTVVFADGTVWLVVLPEKKGGCGCR